MSFRESTIALCRVKAILEADLSTAFYQIKNSTNEMLKQIGVTTNEIYQQDFLKITALNCSTKEVMISSFRRTHCSKPSSSNKWAKIKFLSKFLY